MLYLANMPAKPVQVSIDRELLKRIDSDPEAVAEGRSAFIRSAVSLYLQAKERQEVDRQIRAAYEGESDAMLAEIEDLMAPQAWPED